MPKRAKRFRDRRRGAVLILVLFVLTGLSVLTVEFSRDVLLDHALSSSTRSLLAAKPLMESGERLASVVLAKNSEEGTPDHPREDWGLFNRELERLSAELQGAELSGNIEDENSRFPLNAIFYEREAERARADAFADVLIKMLAGLMRVHGYAGGADNAARAARDYVDSLRQWGGQTETDEESLKWYLNRSPRRLPPGRPPQAPEEILLVRWPHMEEAWARRVLEGTETLPGLLETLSVWTRGPMNVNTLRPEVLAALVRDERQARAFVSAILRYRDNPDNELKEKWYQDIFSSYDVPTLPNGCLDVRSRWYRLNLTVRQGARENRLTAVGWATHEYVTWEYRAVR
ncbi:MAG TPA: general secretion pathway protein GspK [Candidatus Bilophila faecipullorum]|uniref:General secretion pathway protein GspK n=1 Tax=Candidatus Bilophila faecipullorum TaxID=2838482 RepID=A0A9D1R0N9_9BACT|nr:type II secretion system protein GspK [uncultured Bilophila sp.]HIW77966.1 general secretion pathway protein GspK [Candidatus Bilophila faecipullorum]